MISETKFDDNDNRYLSATEFTLEMAVHNEWVVRDESDPDNLLVVYLKPAEDGNIQAACSCPLGSRDEKCLHALRVINEVKDHTWLLRQLFQKPSDNNIAA